MNHSMKCSVTLLFALAFSVAGHAQGQTSIMLLGDSITHGVQGYVGYRYPLWYNFQDAGINVDFVGSQTTPRHGIISSLYGDYANFDVDHQGFSGYRTDQIINDGKGFTIAGAAATYTPDIVSIHLGTNDIIQNTSNGPGYQPALGNLTTIVSQLRVANPNVKVLLSQIMPLHSNRPQDFEIPGYNTAVANLATSLSTTNSPVVLVDQFTGFHTSALIFDGIHPKNYGEQLMADRYFVALQPLIDPSAPLVSPEIHISNSSFDDKQLADNGAEGGALSQGWSFYGNSTGGAAGLFNPTSSSYTGAAGSTGTPQGGEGDTVGFLFNRGTPAPRIEQQLGAILMADTEYALTVGIGNRHINNDRNTTYGGYQLEILAGDTVIATQTDLITPSPGTFEDALLFIDANSFDSNLLHEELRLRFTMSSLVSRTSTDFDNVRFTATTTVPEPASLMLISLGSIAILTRRRR